MEPGQLSAASAGSDHAERYFDGLAERFERAAEGAGLHGDDLEIAGVHVRLRFAGTAMRDVLLPPFEHLRTQAPAEPELRISVFDTASTGVEPPAAAWQPIAAPTGTNPAALLRSADVCVLAAQGTRAITATAPARGEAVFHLPDAADVSPIERAAPLREALGLLMAPRGRWMTHAGAVGAGGAGTLLVGRGGAGKSTLSLACALAGMEIVADDYVLLETDPPVAHAMQSTAKLTEDAAARLDLAAGSLVTAAYEPTLEGPPKALVAVEDLAPGQLRRQLRIGALVAPRIAGASAPRLGRVSGAEGLRALAPSTVFQSGAGGGASLAALGELVRRVPCFELALSPDAAANAEAIARLVDDLA